MSKELCPFPKLKSVFALQLLAFHKFMSVKSFKTTIKSVLSGHSKIDKTKILMINGSLMKVESIAECSPWSILQHF